MKEYEKQHRIFYVFLRNLVAFLLLILNGKSKYYNVDRIPKDENYILVAPHPVSYTHLDVYKRQCLFCKTDKCLKKELDLVKLF